MELEDQISTAALLRVISAAEASGLPMLLLGGCALMETFGAGP